MTATTNVTLDNLLDTNLDDLADMPEFKPYPNGAHLVNLHWEKKDVGGHPSIEMKFKYHGAIELAGAGEEAPKQGAEAQCLYTLDSEMGQGSLKKLMNEAGATDGIPKGTLGSMLTQYQDQDVVIITNQRTVKGKNGDPDKVYMSVTKMNKPPQV